MFEDGIYKTVGIVVVAGLFIILVCKLLGFQAKIVEGFSLNDLESSSKDKDKSSGGGVTSGTSKSLAADIDDSSKTKLNQATASDGRGGHEQLLEALDNMVRVEILRAMLNTRKDNTGNWTGELAAPKGGNLIDDDKAMGHIQKLNELWKFHETIDAAMGILDSTTLNQASLSS